MAANTAAKVSSYQACSAPKALDALMILSANTTNNATNPYITKHSTVAQLFSNVTSNTIQATIVTSNSIVVSSHSTPANNSAGSLALGTMWTDDDYIYVVTGSGIRRAALTDF